MSGKLPLATYKNKREEFAALWFRKARFLALPTALIQRTIRLRPMIPSLVTLRPTDQADLAFFFQFQLDPEAAYLAAFMPKERLDEAAYVEKYTRFLQDPTIHMQTILVAGTVVGSLAKFEIAGEAELTYWLDRAHWEKGLATSALRAFLTLESTRPLLGRVAFDNIGSQKVLEKNGFVKIGAAKGFANARQAEIAEFIYKLL